MAKTKQGIVFVCSNCGNEYSRWQGQCSACGEWNTLKEALLGVNQKRTGGAVPGRSYQRTEVVNLGKVRSERKDIKSIITTKISEFDRVLGKGIVQGSVVLFSGEPGIGKSTLLTQLVGNIGGLYVAGEESAEQIVLRVSRLKLDPKNFDILGTNSVEEIIEFLERTKNVYNIVVVDSIQVMSTENGSGGAGSPSQIRESTFRLIEVAKRIGVPMFIVGHVTKEGDIAGPKLLEHMVDSVLYFEGERNSDLRILRANKNRFGPTDEVGVFKMEESGLREIKSDEISLVEGTESKVGAAVTVVMEGTRPMMLEIQALVTESFAQMPKRVFSGIDFNRGQLLVAVAQKVLGIPLYNQDVYVSVTGGVRVEDTAADLAVVAAMWSSFRNLPLPKTHVFVGEVSLLGEVKRVRGMEKRNREAESLGRKLVMIKSIRELKIK